MKNMLDELKELNNEEAFEVSTDFRDKVIERIYEEENTSKFKYIIPMCSTVAIVIVAVVVTITGRFSNVDMLDAENEMIYAQGSIEKNDEDSDEMVMDLAMMPETMQDNAVNKAMTIEERSAQDVGDAYYDEIIDMLKINNIIAERKDNVIRTKAKKEDVENVLVYFENNVTIEQDGEYVIIKMK